VAAQNVKKFLRDFGLLRDLIANFSGTQQDSVNPKRTCKLQLLPQTL